MRKANGIIGFLFAFVVSTPLVNADVAPTPPYNADCTVEKQQKEGEECVSCLVQNAWGVASCENETEYLNDGYTRRCRTAEKPGSYNEVTIYCRPIPQTVVDDAGQSDAQVSVINSQPEENDAQVSVNNSQPEGNDAQVSVSDDQPAGNDARVSVINSQPGGNDAQASVSSNQPVVNDAPIGSEKAGKTDKGICSVSGVGRGRANPIVFLLLGLISLALFVRRRG